MPGELAGPGFAHTVQTGPVLVAAGVAVLVGVVGFLSPCVLPLVPGYLSYVAGLTGEAERPSQRRMVAGAFLFVLGRTYMARKFTHEQAVTAIVVSYYWHFVDVVWIGLFATIYLVK